MRVLLIEDDVQVAEVLRLYLEGEGFEMDAATTGEDGLRRFEKAAPRPITQAPAKVPR